MSDSAFPQIESKSDSPAGYYVTEVFSAGGLTRRELFAAMAMQGLLASPHPIPAIGGDKSDPMELRLGRMACLMADSLIAELGKTNE